ncbi:Superfamily II DNA and RNA helicase [Methanosarcina mazei Go1]|uniref:Superfamily II DNA and RNA helicase n=2 Tax=Methanosarcina mazei TaxID=2209 RepID=Q8Q061_METMA|nr:Superfamily II DNA and RNA helicase [Methanosarcina mazei Go1]
MWCENMRDKYIEELIKEVLGPRNGSEETMIGSDPYTEYITGVIIPKDCKQRELSPDSEILNVEGDDKGAEDADSQENTFSILPSELDPRVRSKSFGISFLVKGKDPYLKVCVTWGRYFKEELISENSNRKVVTETDFSWKRKPYCEIFNLNMSGESSEEITIYEGIDGKIVLNSRGIKVNNSLHIILSLINELKIGDCYGDKVIESSLYQPSIRVILGNDCKLESIDSEENDELNFIYRENPVLARGHMCSSIWKDVDYQDKFDIKVLWPDGIHFDKCREFIICDVRSEFVPLYPNPAPIFEWTNSEISNSPVFSALKLSEMWDETEIKDYLNPILKSYEQWILKNETSLEDFSEKDKILAKKLIDKQKICLKRINRGIECLQNDKDILLSFCFANKVIWLQNLWKRGGKLGESNIDFVWRPFQLAFFLMNLESLSNKNSEFRDYVDLLWVPTGGGKTESYLAMMAFVMVLRRRNAQARVRNGEKDNKDITGAGTSVISRYTLRLLTVQQFRRTLIMITAAEYLRVFNNQGLSGWRPQKYSTSEDWLYGTVRFSVGMWVGGGVSPNHLRGEQGAIKALQNSSSSEGEPAQIVKCPVCGTWLAVPSSGLPAGVNKIYFVIKYEKTLSELKSHVSKLTSVSDLITEIQVLDDRCLINYFIMYTKLDSSRKVDEKEFDDIISKLEKELNVKVASFRPSRSGYFPSYNEVGRRKDSPVDFEIFCPNPECDLNSNVNHKEGVPSNVSGNSKKKLPDGLFVKDNASPFAEYSHIPIPAYTVDEQIYHRCPTIIVSTADKIARLAFEPRCSSIFGNISKYNGFYGYYRGDSEEVLPNNCTKNAISKYSSNVNPFLPPDMIVQDELHLMDGPLGSMFGIYECIVDGLIRESGGSPKYIASSATVNDAAIQVKSLFNRPLSQFPAYGLTFKDSFFVRMPAWSSGWDENRPGRVYMGIYAPGRGPLTPIIRIWSRMLQTGGENCSEKGIVNFWTLVGYFNSIRELGGNRSLFREDIIERLNNISKDSVRNLDAEKVVELSSRINSTDIPQLLEELEQGKNRTINENPDAIFTTSMFGTGVDIPHLSLMVVNGQPKTTSQYIQATGRVGRDHGALVVTFYKAGRARDLSHYEIFTGYHHRINIEVEPASVSPFSDGCLEKAAGPAIVSFLRNMPDPSSRWFAESGHTIQNEESLKDFEIFLRTCLPSDISKKVIQCFRSQYDRWLGISQKLGFTENLVYNEYTLYRPPEKNVILGDPAHEKVGLCVVYKNAPQSLREIEETTAFEV